MIINHNLPAMNAERNLWENSYKIGKTQERLSSGLRINRAADDAAGLAISETMRAQVRGLSQANRNAQDAVSLIQTADGALSNVGAILTRMRELAVQAANDTYTSNDRQQLQGEIDQLKGELDRTANTTSFNNKFLLDGSSSALVSTDNINTKVFMRGSLIDTLGISHAGSYKINIVWNSQGASQQQTSNVMLDRTTNLIAGAGTQLKNVAQFYDNNGRFIADNPQTITLVEGSGRRAFFTIYDNDTLSGVAYKFDQAISMSAGLGGLGQGIYLSGNTDMFCTITTATISQTMEAVSGVFCLRSAKAGDDGTLTVIADQTIINAFGFTDYQAANMTSYQITITNANNGAAVNTATIKGNAALGLVYNTVDVKFDNRLANSAVWSAASAIIQMNTGNSAATYIHLVDNSQAFQLGANELQNMQAAIGNMRSDALGVDNILLTNVITAGKSITKIDMAYQKVSQQRSYIGAVQNRLEVTMNNLGVARENIQAAESRIRDADMAKEMMEFTRLNILTQAATAMLAQANTLPQQALQLLGR